MAISKKQRMTMALIVIVGILGGAAVLLAGRTTAHAAAGHDDAHAAEAAAVPKGGSKKQHVEGQVKLSAAQLQASGITVQAARPAQLAATTQFHGEIRLDEDSTSHVVPRLAGVAEAVFATLGQQVQKGQVLAVIASTSLAEQRSALLTAQKRQQLAKSTYEREKQLWEDKISARQDFLEAQAALQEADIAVTNAAQQLAAVGGGSNAGGAVSGNAAGLNRLAIRAPLTGTVVEKHLSLGESVKEDASIFTVADLGTVWAEFAVAPTDLAAVRVGQRVVVSSTAFDSTSEGTVSYVGALLGEQTRTARARVTLRNPQAVWRPGLFVTVTLLGDNQQLPLAVLADAVQTIGNESVVFKAVPGGFVATPLQLGRSDGRVVEVLGGLQAGDSYAASKVFILKSELGKGSADHGH